MKKETDRQADKQTETERKIHKHRKIQIWLYKNRDRRMHRQKIIERQIMEEEGRAIEQVK